MFIRMNVEQLSLDVIISDVRTEKQANKNVSYDVGQRILGARKFLAQTKQNFLEKPSLETLNLLENEDVSSAAELVTRDTFFRWFSLENCKERGVEPVVAKGLQLLIHRISKFPNDTKQDRENYTKSALFVSELFENVHSLSDFKEMEQYILKLVNYEREDRNYILSCIKSLEESMSYENEPKYLNAFTRKIEEYKSKLKIIDQANSLKLSSLGKSFCVYFTRRSSRETTYQTMSKYTSWDDLLKKKEKKQREKKKLVWERSLPERPDRHGGEIVSVQKPEDLVALFNFRGLQFGHWVDDEKAMEHLQRSAEAFHDLASILKVLSPTLSLDGTLGIAFGARGKGRAFAHYEPAQRVINLTKHKGSLGVLAHEFFHALDHYIYSVSHDNKKGKIGYASVDELGTAVTGEVISIFQELREAMTQGRATATIDVSNRKSYRLYPSFILKYNRFEGDLQAIMDDIMEEFDEHMAKSLRGYISEKYYFAQKEKFERKRKIYLRRNAEALAQYHEEVTGKSVHQIPYSTNRTQFYQTAIEFDKGNIGKYWSSTHELAARAFEAYVFDELQKRGWKSDYLVCGVNDIAYPSGEERERINKVIHRMIEIIRPLIQE